MKINNKGLTIIELLATTVIIGLVLTLLLQTMYLLKKEDLNNTKNFTYALDKLKLVREIENDLRSNSLVKIIDNSKDNLNITFIFQEGTSTLIALEQEINYTNLAHNNYTFKVKDYLINPCAKLIYRTQDPKSYFKLNIFIINKDTKKTSDSLEVTYALDRLLEMTSNNINNNVGICTN